MKYNDFTEIIENGRKQFGSHAALQAADSFGTIRTLSYEELYERIMTRRKELAGEKVSVVGLCGTPSFEWVIDFFAAPLAGKRTVLLDISLSHEAIQSLIDEYEIDAVLPANTGYRTSAPKEGKPEYGGCILVFTSGTTHANKAVVLSQKALAYSAWNGQQMLPCGTDDIIPAMLPLNHVFGLVCTLLWPLSNGATVALGRGMRFFAEDPALYKATILVMVPTLINFLYGVEAINPQCHTILVGAAPCSETVLKAIQTMGIRLSFGYGLSETASGVAISVGSDDPFAFDLCPDTKISLGEDGEVLLQTTCMMEEYWHRPKETEEALKDGWLHTGDLGSLDEKGRLHLSGRKNDVLVLTNGEKVYCPEAEAQLSEMIGKDAALSVMYDVLTLIAADHADEETVKKAIDQYNAAQPISKRIMNYRIAAGELPRTATGKLCRWKMEEIL